MGHEDKLRGVTSTHSIAHDIEYITLGDFSIDRSFSSYGDDSDVGWVTWVLQCQLPDGHARVAAQKVDTNVIENQQQG